MESRVTLATSSPTLPQRASIAGASGRPQPGAVVWATVKLLYMTYSPQNNNNCYTTCDRPRDKWLARVPLSVEVQYAGLNLPKR